MSCCLVLFFPQKTCTGMQDLVLFTNLKNT